MNHFKDVLSKKSWVVLHIGFLPTFLIVFRPSILEVAFWLAAEVLGLLLVIPYESRSLLIKYPQYRWLLNTPNPTADLTHLEGLSPVQRSRCILELMRFPMIRSLSLVRFSLLKILPACGIILWVWQFDVPFYIQLARLIFVGALAHSFFFAAALIDHHLLVSKILRVVHSRLNWSREFCETPIPPQLFKQFRIHESLSLVSIWVFMTGLLTLSVLTCEGDNRLALLFEALIICLTGLLWFSHLWQSHRDFLIDGLHKIFDEMETTGGKISDHTLAFHSSPTLARFERTFNRLIFRVEAFERELARWILHKADQGRFQYVGQTAALIVHDLAAPAQTIEFCVSAIKKNPALIHNARYVDQLQLSASRVSELIQSLRAYLKNIRTTHKGPDLKELLDYVRRLLEVQFTNKGYSEVSFDIFPEVFKQSVDLTASDLIHIFLNLFSNSCENFYTHSVTAPQIVLDIKEETPQSVTFGVYDNGSGLSGKDFLELTSFALFQNVEASQGVKSLGLRLVRRLVETNYGSLELSDPNPLGKGTLYLLTLPKVNSVPNPLDG